MRINAGWRSLRATQATSILCHPFLVDAASWPHRETTPRFMAQPELAPIAPLELERADADYPALEIAVRLGLGLHQGRKTERVDRAPQ